MPFVWTENIAINASIDAADINEVKTNLDSIYTALGITRGGCGAGAGWVELPVAVDSLIESADFQEMRDVTDFAKDNKCPAYDATDRAPFNATADSGVLNNDHGTYNSNHDLSEDVDDKGTYESYNMSAEDTSEHGTYNSGANSGILDDDHGTYESGHDTGYCTEV